MSKRAIIDIDNTIGDYANQLYLECLKENPNVSKPEAWDDWEFYESYMSKNEFYNAASRAHEHTLSMPLIPGAKQLMDFLYHSAGCHVTIASHRRPEHYDQTMEWLKANNIPYHDLHISYDKSVLFDGGCDIFVDDGPHNVEKAIGRVPHIYIPAMPWNDCVDNNKVFRGNLVEILDKIEEDIALKDE